MECSECLEATMVDLKQMLREGVEKGYWTLDSLDRPSPGFVSCSHVDRRAFPGGYEGVQHRNLLKAPGIPHPETVEVINNKDLPPMPHGVTPAESHDLPLTLDEEESPAPFQAGGETHAADEHPHQPDQLPAAAGSEALPWE